MKQHIFLLSYHLGRRSDEGWGQFALVYADDMAQAIEKLKKEKAFEGTDALSKYTVTPDHIECLNIE